MTPQPIAFLCPHCGILLSVPAEQAGIQGPCPMCSHEIRAPIPAIHPGFPSPYASALPQNAPPSPSNSEKQATGSKLAIEPRSTPSSPPDRSGTTALKEIRETKEKSEPSGELENLSTDEPEIEPRPSHHMLRRSVMPLIFLLAAVALISVVIDRLTNQEDPILPGQAQASADQNSPANTSPPDSQAETSTSTQTANTGNPAKQHIKLSPTAASDAISLLEKFLRASSLDERLPLIETKTPTAELPSSILASSFPAFRNLTIESQESFPLENIVDMYFSFEFVREDLSADPQTIVVRHRGGLTPRVFADPFLDLYGGRLADYAAKPQSKGRMFHVLVTPFPSCNNLKIPDRGKKITLRLHPHENSENVIQAYVSRVSKIGEIIDSGHYDLTYGKPKACVILLGWNSKESPGAPYLEALDIRAYHWNP